MEAEGAVILGRAHAVTAALLGARAGDRWLVSVAASAAYSAINRATAAIEDAHEERFHQAHAEALAAVGLAGGRAEEEGLRAVGRWSAAGGDGAAGAGATGEVSVGAGL